jgi:hypothetical protein
VCVDRVDVHQVRLCNSRMVSSLSVSNALHFGQSIHRGYSAVRRSCTAPLSPFPYLLCVTRFHVRWGGPDLGACQPHESGQHQECV